MISSFCSYIIYLISSSCLFLFLFKLIEHLYYSYFDFCADNSQIFISLGFVSGDFIWSFDLAMFSFSFFFRMPFDLCCCWNLGIWKNQPLLPVFTYYLHIGGNLHQSAQLEILQASQTSYGLLSLLGLYAYSPNWRNVPVSTHELSLVFVYGTAISLVLWQVKGLTFVLNSPQTSKVCYCLSCQCSESGKTETSPLRSTLKRQNSEHAFRLSFPSQ